MYLAFLFVALSLAYFPVAWLLTIFFENRRPVFAVREALRSIGMIAVVAATAIGASMIIPDLELGNRILHALGGGFLVVFICARAARDMHLHIRPLQFVIFATLVATALGVGNELAEFALQYSGLRVFARSVDDTWLDLASNTVGIIAGLCMSALRGERP